MESSAAGGDPRPLPSASGGASPPAAPPPPPRGWIAGLVSGAGRLLAAVLGPESSGSTAGVSGGDSPSASCSPVSPRPPGPRGEGYNYDHGDSPIFPLKNNQLNQGEKETDLKDYAGSLAIVSEIEPKDAIMQLLMQETYSRSEYSKFIKIIQERVLDSDSGDVDVGGFALPSARKAGRQAVDGAAAGTIPKLTHTNESPSIHNANNIQPVLKRNYSVREDAYEEVRRVRPKINGNPLNISKFKQVGIIRNHPAANSREELTAKNLNASINENKLSPDVLGANNLTYPNIISKVESADEILDGPNKPSTVPPQPFDSSSPQAGRDRKNYDTTILNRCSSQDLKKGFPLKVEPVNVFIPFEQQMMDLSHQKQEHAVCDDSCSLSKLMLKEDIEAAPSLPMGVRIQNGSKNRRRRQPNSQKVTPTSTRSPAKGSPQKNNDGVVKSEIDLLEQEPELGAIPVKRPVGRPRKAR
ncbi:uncharacterized protein LOC133925980 isoform X2 [Phragmites australis]|uniref:uncharacterized protein LOC133925980 isoform X2 n=1 Tax=Phragmites australis TaxID=29695 RepID=UPI002D78CDFB|nr:uncharacterized protein LOC133925980 isoform X2 [Phragmites australis]